MVDSKIVELTFVLIPSLTCICHGKNRAFFYGLTGRGGGGEKSWFRNREIKILLAIRKARP